MPHPVCKKKLKYSLLLEKGVSVTRYSMKGMGKESDMFGYVSVNKPELKVKEFERYQAYYCGLCKSLKKGHGRRGQLTLNYDMTFLTILLTGLYEPDTKEKMERCLVHPFHKHKTQTNAYSDYAADMNIALTYYKFLDDWQDDRSKKAWFGIRLYKKRFEKVKLSYPRQCEAIRNSIDKLTKYEKARSSRLDEVAGCFGTMMEEIFVYKPDEWEEHLRKMGFFLGKYIYLLDAYEDLQKDQEKGRYNPYLELCKSTAYESECREILTMMMAECAKEFEVLPIIEDAGLLKNIIYSGVWTRYEAATNREKKKGKQT